MSKLNASAYEPTEPNRSTVLAIDSFKVKRSWNIGHGRVSSTDCLPDEPATVCVRVWKGNGRRSEPEATASSENVKVMQMVRSWRSLRRRRRRRRRRIRRRRRDGELKMQNSLAQGKRWFGRNKRYDGGELFRCVGRANLASAAAAAVACKWTKNLHANSKSGKVAAHSSRYVEACDCAEFESKRVEFEGGCLIKLARQKRIRSRRWNETRSGKSETGSKASDLL